MRTKTLLGLAALAVSAATVVAADNVYSLNVVGYVNVPIPEKTVGNGFYIACNPLQVNDAVNGNNALNSVIPVTSVPQGTTLFRWDVTLQSFDTATAGQDDNGNPAWDRTWTLAPGEGFWVQNLGATGFNITFVGEVLQGPQNNPIPAGFTLKGSQVPQAAELVDVLQFPAVNSGTSIYLWTPGVGYSQCDRVPDDNGNPSWSTLYPVGATAGVTPAVGQGFWVNQTTATTWARTFNVPN
jgi:hypothetical protein